MSEERVRINWQERARHRALARLAEEFPARYEQLHAEEMERAELDEPTAAVEFLREYLSDGHHATTAELRGAVRAAGFGLNRDEIKDLLLSTPFVLVGQGTYRIVGAALEGDRR